MKGSSPLRRAGAAALTLLLTAGQAPPAFAYLKFGVDIGGRFVPLKWARTPVQYFVNDTVVPGVSTADFQAAAARAFGVWDAVPTSAIAYTFGGVTASQ